jgi:hypothetical protein
MHFGALLQTFQQAPKEPARVRHEALEQAFRMLKHSAASQFAIVRDKALGEALHYPGAPYLKPFSKPPKNPFVSGTRRLMRPSKRSSFRSSAKSASLRSWFKSS